MAKSQDVINFSLEAAVVQLTKDVKEVHSLATETLSQTKLTNGRVTTAENNIELIKQRIENEKAVSELKQKERDRMWAIAMLALGSIIGLGSYIIYNL